MHTYILTLILFLSHGLVSSSTISAPSKEDCEAARPLIEATHPPGSTVSMPPSKTRLTVLDAQTTPCQRVDSHAR
jgi:ABC-type Fe3+-hydroxamate transport system substrate-binding protein